MFKQYFPIFKNQEDLVYLDSAATTLKPAVLLQSLEGYYENYTANVHRGLYPNAEKVTEEFDQARTVVANLINANSNEIVFTHNATDALNTIALALDSQQLQGRKVLISESEHHSNLVVWQEFAKRNKLELCIVEYAENWEQDLLDQIDDSVALLGLSLMSNVTGLRPQSLDKIMKKASGSKVITVLDACQSIVHQQDDVKALNCDFLVFSAHKLYGPTGLGILYIKSNLMQLLNPVRFGGGMVEDVQRSQSSYLEGPMKFEAGTPNIAAVLAFAKVLEFLREISFEKIYIYELELAKYLHQQLSQLSGFKVLGGLQSVRTLYALDFDMVHSHDLAYGLGMKNICVRAGQHCTNPLHASLDSRASLRVSLGMYNTCEDIDKFVLELKKVLNFFKK